MSVRTIPKNYRNLTGLAASTKAEKPFFESTLERDFLTLLEF
ncbi:heteromeric transposase endonuclease subunit TnsA, partial [Vibrio anguillarum]|nr:heteromeric transposase endonuclease subunit TnsA [Vibrio anguillarum]